MKNSSLINLPHARRKRRTIEEKSEYLAKINEARIADYDLTDEEACKKVGVPISSVRRWRHELNAPSRSEILLSGKDRLGVNDAIAALVAQGSDYFEFMESLFTLAIWLRFPSKPQYIGVMTTVFLLNYLMQKTGANTLADLSHDALLALSTRIRLNDIRRVLSIELVDMPVFHPYYANESGKRYLKEYVVADLCWFLLSAPLGKQRFASLARAFMVQAHPASECQWNVGLNAYRDLWSTYAPTAAFHYIRFRNFTLDPLLDVTDKNFSSYVDDICGDRLTIIRYLGEVKSTQMRLQARLDPRALTVIAFPSFPDTLPSVHVPHLPLPQPVLAALAEL